MMADQLQRLATDLTTLADLLDKHDRLVVLEARRLADRLYTMVRFAIDPAAAIRLGVAPTHRVKASRIDSHAIITQPADAFGELTDSDRALANWCEAAASAIEPIAGGAWSSGEDLRMLADELESTYAAVSDTRGKAPGEADGGKMVKLAHAMQLVHKHPDWSNRAIAKEVGVAASTLGRWDAFRTAAHVSRQGHTPPRGHVSGNGDVEAYDDDHDLADMHLDE